MCEENLSLEKEGKKFYSLQLHYELERNLRERELFLMIIIRFAVFCRTRKKQVAHQIIINTKL